MGRLFLRVFLWFWLGSTAVMLVLLGSVYLVEPDLLTTWRFIGRAAMQSVGAQVANAYERDGEAAAATLAATIGQEGRFRVWLYTAEARLVAGPSPITDAPAVVASALASDGTERSASGDASLLARRTTSDAGTPYVVVWQAPLPRAEVSPARLAWRMAALVLTGALACAWLTWHITKPIRMLRDATRRFAAGELTVRVGHAAALRRGDELSDLAIEFDHMAARIDTLVKSQQQLLGDISHELRSPLARLSLALELAQRRVGTPLPEHTRIEQEAQRLNALIGQLLTLARLREPSLPAAAEAVDLGELVREVAQDACFEAEAAGRSVEVAAECEARVRGSRALLRSALDNVVRNAVRHAPEGSSVSIAMAREPDHRIVMTVRDQGPGVPAHTLSRLFDPFFRVDEAREERSGGTGLGLAITRHAVEAHGGRVTAQNHPDGGLLVRLDLPIREEG